MFFMSVKIHIAVLRALIPCNVVCSMWIPFCRNLLSSSSGSTHEMGDIFFYETLLPTGLLILFLVPPGGYQSEIGIPTLDRPD